MSDILFNLIKDKIYNDKEIRKVSFDSLDKVTSWIFDFKSQGLTKIFLEEYSKYFWDVFQGEYGIDIQIGGMEAGAISIITGVLLYSPSKINSTGFYIRKSRKKSDLANLVEGDLRSNVPIILVDDILNGGKTIRKQVKIIEELGCKVSAVFVCLRFRDMEHYQDLIDKGIKIFSIFELNDFSKVLPVKNLNSEIRPLSFEKYEFKYKVTLSNKPNLYKIVPKSAPLLIGEFIYMGVDDGSFYCLCPEDGSVVWTYRILFGSKGKRIFSSPTVYKDKVLFGAYDGNVYCLNRFSGKREWVFTDADWVGSSPDIDSLNGIVFIGLEFGLFKKHGGVVAINIKSGDVVWKNYEMSGFTHASPAYNKKYGILICGCNDGCVYAFNTKTGKILWKFETKGEVKEGATFDEKEDLVVIGSMDGGLYILNVKDGTLYHKFEARFGLYSTPAIKGNYVVIGSLDKNVYCFNLYTKKTEWVFETSGRIFASPLIDRESIFVGSNDGILYELDIVTGRLVSSVQLTERIVNKIQVGFLKNGKYILYIPTHIGELYKMVQNDYLT